jgi:hypothetical protein
MPTVQELNPGYEVTDGLAEKAELDRKKAEAEAAAKAEAPKEEAE